jgi:hypothetical protein
VSRHYGCLIELKGCAEKATTDRMNNFLNCDGKRGGVIWFLGVPIGGEKLVRSQTSQLTIAG